MKNNRKDISLPIIWDYKEKKTITPFGETFELPFEVGSPIVVCNNRICNTNNIQNICVGDYDGDTLYQAEYIEVSRLGCDYDGDLLYPINQKENNCEKDKI